MSLEQLTRWALLEDECIILGVVVLEQLLVLLLL
jgi:hypothetical protein